MASRNICMFKEQYTFVLNQLCSSLWTSPSWVIEGSCYTFQPVSTKVTETQRKRGNIKLYNLRLILPSTTIAAVSKICYSDDYDLSASLSTAAQFLTT